MNDSFQSLPQLNIATPCPKSWAEMSGDDQARFCSHCCKTVLDFAQMSTDEVSDVLQTGESVCARIQRKSDGTIVTRDCETLQQPQPSRRDWMSRLMTLAAMGLAMLTLVGCRNDGDTPDTTQPNQTTEGPMVMGEVSAPIMGDICIEPVDTPEQQPIVGKVRIIDPTANESE